MFTPFSASGAAKKGPARGTAAAGAAAGGSAERTNSIVVPDAELSYLARYQSLASKIFTGGWM
jgi:hypothetical protein